MAAFIISTFYLLATSPYSRDTIVQPAFETSYINGQVDITARYTPRYYSGWLATAIGYYRGGLAMVWDRITSPKLPAGNVESIISGIHTMRFDPSKPYLISGDQFDGLYPRNLSIFYENLLNPKTFTSATDKHNRERIAVQSLAYCLTALEQLKRPVTTLMPIGGRGVLALNIYDYPSDTMFSAFALITKLESTPDTHKVALQLSSEYRAGLSASYQNYLATVEDPATGLVRRNIQLSGARDAAQRQSSFYDNVILWKTKQLATQLGLDHVSNSDLAKMRAAILQRYWDKSQGHFIDDLRPGNSNSYSSDWLIALPLGFLTPSNPDDLSKLIKISTYTDQEHLTNPLPIRYTNAPDSHENIFVRLFVGSYGSTAVWSYWGDEYIALETSLYKQTKQKIYANHVGSALSQWQKVIIRDRGYPETLNNQGEMRETPVYESIRRNGWITDFEAIRYDWSHVNQNSASTKP